MNIIQKVTWKCMKQNKKRTIVTVVGVTICVAMITAVCILALSFQDVLSRNVMETKGSYDASYYIGDDVALMDKLYQEDSFDQIERVGYIGNASTEGFHLTEAFRTSVDINAIDMKNSALHAVALLQGKLAEKSDEIVISEEMSKEKGFTYQLGDKITLPIQRYSEDGKVIETYQKRYTLTGIVKSSEQNYNANAFVAYVNYATAEKLTPSICYVTFKDKSDLESSVKDIKDKYQINDDNVQTNYTLWVYQGYAGDAAANTIYSVCAVLFLIILIGGVSLIYNAFSISLSERSRYLGMLSSIGATRKQKRNSVLYEASMIGIMAIPLGIISGIVGLMITFHFMNPYVSMLFSEASPTTQVGLRVIMNGWIVLITILFSGVILVLSAWIPARKASKISAIHAIRQNESIKVHRRDIKTGKMVGRMFGVEVVLALKNIKRFRSRYLSNVSSLIICIVLFMTASYFSSGLQESVRMSSSNIEIDVLTTLYPLNDEEGKSKLVPTNIINELLAIPSASSSIAVSHSTLTLGQNVKVTKEARDHIKQKYGIDDDYMKDYHFGVVLQVIDDDNFNAYSKQIGMNLSDLDTALPAVILIENTSTKAAKERNYADVTWLDVKENEDVVLFNQAISNEESERPTENEHVKVKVVKKTSELPPIYIADPEIIMITNQTNLTKLNNLLVLYGQEEIIPMYEFQYRSSDSARTVNELDHILAKYTDTYQGFTSNLSANRMLSEQRSLLINVLLFGFLSLISLVCIANIINTITTSIELRKREFAMIKSIGITPHKFNNMIRFETLLYGFKACLYGIPIGTLLIFMLYAMYGQSFAYHFVYPWTMVFMVVLALFIVLSLTMSYAVHKIKKNNIVETIRCESM